MMTSAAIRWWAINYALDVVADVLPKVPSNNLASNVTDTLLLLWRHRAGDARRCRSGVPLARDEPVVGGFGCGVSRGRPVTP